MAQLWKIDEYENEELLEERPWNHQVRETGEKLATYGYSQKLVAIDDETNTVVWEYTPESWK